jgi:hypothetical protein
MFHARSRTTLMMTKVRPPAGFRLVFSAPTWVLLLAMAGCGGGGGGGSASSASSTTTITLPTGSNVQALVVDSGPPGFTLNNRVGNVPFTSVTVCLPGSTTQCQTIDHVIVDTGSTGLRLLSSVLTLTFPATTVTGGQTLLNCVKFLDNTYMWGAVATADLLMGDVSSLSAPGEKAASLPIQVVGSSGLPTAPTSCSGGTTTNASDTVAKLGAKGILGVGNRVRDCGSSCTTTSANGIYYTSSGGVAVGSVASLAQQLQQPVNLFASDNNGVIMSFPNVPDPGAVTVSGALTFGIGTQANNSPGSGTTMLALNGSGNFTTAFGGNTLSSSFVDSGSNGLFFGSSNYPVCAGGWYCPAATTALQATNTGTNGVASLVSFSVSNATSLFSNGSFSAWSTLAGPIGNNSSFDFGLPFFYGRHVFTAIEGKSTPIGVGPYVAY